MNYIEGFVAAVPTSKKAEFIVHAKKCGECFKEHGAIRLVDCWGDDIPGGEKTSFPMAVQCEADETVVFSWIEWPSREVRMEGMQKVMDDPRMGDDVNPMPFDGSRLIFGGFEMILDQ